ncbi:MAG: PipX family protein [Cyanobacteria bacterium P01_D01_bin.123]
MDRCQVIGRRRVEAIAPSPHLQVSPMQETYINHPTFGLLYSLCAVGTSQGLFTTLYAQRLFFRVSLNPALSEDTVFQSVSRSEAKLIVEAELRNLRREGKREALAALEDVYRRTFV